jgi:hypothetical protein
VHNLQRPLTFRKHLGHAMLEDQRRAIATRRAAQTACAALDMLRAFESPAYCRDKEDTIAQERASVEKALVEIIADLSAWLPIRPDAPTKVERPDGILDK